MSIHEVCVSCEESRRTGDFEVAIRCHGCKGTGIKRKNDSYPCNGCGGDLCAGGYPHGLVEHTVSGGYSSTHLLDCTTYGFSLCEACLRRLFETFKIPPTIGAYMVGEVETYAEERKLYLWNIWHAAGGHIEKAKTGLCN